MAFTFTFTFTFTRLYVLLGLGFIIVTGVKLSLWLIKRGVMKFCGEWDAILRILHLGTWEKKVISLAQKLLSFWRSSTYRINKNPRGTPQIILVFLRKENIWVPRGKENVFRNKICKRCSGSVAKMICQDSNQLLGVPLQHTLVPCPQHMLTSLWQSKGITTNMSLNGIRAHSPWAHRSYCCSCVLVTGPNVVQYTHHCKNKRRT